MNEHEHKSRPFIYVRERPIMRSLTLVYVHLFIYVRILYFLFV